MPDVHIEKLGSEHAEELLTLMRVVWQDTYVDTDLMDPEVLADSLPYTSERIRTQEKNLQRQYLPNDESKPQYFGAFDEADVLIGFVKTAKPHEDLNRYGGHETLRQKFARKVLRMPAKLVDPSLTEIVELNVRPDRQRQGVGTALVNEALSKLPPYTQNVRLFTQVKTQGFFRRFGFSPNGEKSFYPDATDGSGVALYGMAAAINDLRRVDR